jgi:hypothetical protein
MYNELPDVYKKVLYNIHGLYINNRNTDFKHGVDISTDFNSRSINIHNVYNHLKNMEPVYLRKMMYERVNMLNNPIFNFINKECMDLFMTSKLMFPELFENKN